MDIFNRFVVQTRESKSEDWNIVQSFDSKEEASEFVGDNIADLENRPEVRIIAV